MTVTEWNEWQNLWVLVWTHKKHNNVNFHFITLPIIGRSTAPHVSAAQCTKPEAKSAVRTPAIAANNREASARMCRAIRRPAHTHNVQQTTTHTHSCSLLPVETKVVKFSSCINYQIIIGFSYWNWFSGDPIINCTAALYESVSRCCYYYFLQ